MEMMSDDRVVLKRTDLYSLVSEELAFLDGLPCDFWARAARACGPDECPHKLVSDTLLGAQCASAYLHRKVFRVVESYPWSLADGDIRGNLAELRALPKPPRDEVTWRIWHLLQQQDDRLEDLVPVIVLMQYIPWSTIAAEQGHGSQAAVHRYHPRYGDEMLGMRSFIHQILAMFRVEKPRRLITKANKELARLEKKNPEKSRWPQYVRQSSHSPPSSSLARHSHEGRTRRCEDRRVH